MKITLIAVALLLVVMATLQVVLALRFATLVERWRERLFASQVSTLPDQALIPSLILAFAYRNGGRVGGPAAVQLTQRSEMRLAPEKAFFPTPATQLSGTRDPAFVWHASGRMAAVLPLQILDAYVDGDGRLQVNIAGSIPIASASSPETSKGEAMRFLAELPWNPDAIVNAAGLSWEQIDSTTIDVSMMTSGGMATVRLFFDHAGDIFRIEAADRPFTVGASNIPMRWTGIFVDYSDIGKYRLPRHGEVAWQLPEGEFVYWRGDIVSITAWEPR